MLYKYRPLWILFLFLLFGCSNDSGPSPSPVETPQASDGTPVKLPGGPLWNIESVGSIGSAWEKKSFQVSSHGKFTISGWAVDQEAKMPAGGVDIVIDGTSHSAQYGGARPDVAAVKGSPTYANSGYTLDLAGEDFTAGSHSMLIRVLSNDRKGFWEVGPYTLEFK